MNNKHDFIQVKIDVHKSTNEVRAQKAIQFRIDQNKTVAVYNLVNNYSLMLFFKQCFLNDARFRKKRQDLFGDWKTRFAQGN